MSSSVALQEGLASSTRLEVKWDVMDSAATKSIVIGEHRKKRTLRISTVKGHMLVSLTYSCGLTVSVLLLSTVFMSQTLTFSLQITQNLHSTHSLGEEMY